MNKMPENLAFHDTTALKDLYESTENGLLGQSRLDQTEIIRTILKKSCEVGSASRVKEAAAEQFPILITHDIDHLNEANITGKFRKLLSADAGFIRRARLGASILKGMRRKDPGFTLEHLLKWHDSMRTCGSFYFISDWVSRRSYRDGYYDLGDVDFASLRGHSIGLHMQRAAITDRGALATEMSRLEDVSGRRITSTRAHHLFFHPNITPHILCEAGVKLDLSIGLNHAIGFPVREGAAFGMKGNDSTVFLSTNVQDTAIFRHKAAPPSFAFDVVDCCAQETWPFVLLLHNAWPAKSPVWQWARELVSYAQSKGGKVCTIDEYSSFHEKVPQ